MCALRGNGNEAWGLGSEEGHIVAEESNLEPSMVAHIRGPGEGHACYRIWKGIEGDKDGFEHGYSVKKISLAKSATMKKSAPKGQARSLNRRDNHCLGSRKLKRMRRASSQILPLENAKRPDDELDTSLAIGQIPSRQLRTRGPDSSSTTRPSP
jgi:hypothetical protein